MTDLKGDVADTSHSRVTLSKLTLYKSARFTHQELGILSHTLNQFTLYQLFSNHCVLLI